MKNWFKFGLGVLGFLMFTSGFSACNKDDKGSPGLTSEEEQSLLFMKEEEKLARDVYLYLFRKYEHIVFDHISGSEQSHMDAITVLIEKYKIEDHSATEEGVFNNPALQQLYVDLTAQGDISLAEALKVGATIEDLDIKDLQDAIDILANEDIQDTYSRLQCGSRNHLRAFDFNLDTLGESYQAQFISQEEYDSIVDGEHESCGL